MVLTVYRSYLCQLETADVRMAHGLVSGWDIIFFIIYFYSHYILQFPFLLSYKSCPYKSFLPLPPPLSEEKGNHPFLGYHPTLGHLVPSGLSTFSSTKAKPSSLGRTRGSNDRLQSLIN